MKSIVQEGSTVIKAVEKALQIAGNPHEFTVKVLEEAQKNFFGMTTRSAKISLLFDIEPVVASKVEKVRIEQPRIEKVKNEKSHKTIEPRQHQPRFAQTRPLKTKQDEQAFWSEEMIATVKDWLTSTISKMDHAPINFEITVNRYYLRVTFTQPLHQDEEKERQIFRSFSYLILQSLRTKLQRPLRGFKIVLTRE